MADALDSYLAGQAFGLVLGGIHAARHARLAAHSAVGSITRNLPKVGAECSDAFRVTDLSELAAQYRALADELDAASAPSAKLSEAA